MSVTIGSISLLASKPRYIFIGIVDMFGSSVLS